MDRSTFILAAMAAAGAEARFDPVRLQKFFFLLDRELDGECGCPHFEFRPHDYGPFDPAVYRQLEQLAARGLATIDESRRYRIHGLTAEGFEQGTRRLAALPERVRNYLEAASRWVLSLHIRDLLASMHEYAPEMAVRSVLREAAAAPRRDRSTLPFIRGMARSLDWTGVLGSRKEESDSGAAALGRYWSAVGGYLRDGMECVDPAPGES